MGVSVKAQERTLLNSTSANSSSLLTNRDASDKHVTALSSKLYESARPCISTSDELQRSEMDTDAADTAGEETNIDTNERGASGNRQLVRTVDFSNRYGEVKEHVSAPSECKHLILAVALCP